MLESYLLIITRRPNFILVDWNLCAGELSTSELSYKQNFSTLRGQCQLDFGLQLV